VVGGAGYIGAMLVPWLLGRGHLVTVYDAMWFGKGSLPQDNEHLRVIQADIRDVRAMDAACEGQDAVICLAGIIAEEMCQRAPEDARAINMVGASAVAVAAANAGVKRFIYASSVAAYPSSDKPSTEETVLQPTTIYGECKVSAEERVLRAIPNAVLVRSASVCGYSQNMRFHVTVNRMMRDAMIGDFIMVNGGDQYRSHVHMYDVCDFYALLLERTETGVFNLVAENQTVRQTAEIVAAETGAKIILGPATDNRSYMVDGTKAREVLGFTPKRTVQEAVQYLKAHFDSDAKGITTKWNDLTTNPVYMGLTDPQRLELRSALA
jgi:nucleoside-diphosphate-sugar epimerase